VHLTKNVPESFGIIGQWSGHGELGFELREQGWNNL